MREKSFEVNKSPCGIKEGEGCGTVISAQLLVRRKKEKGKKTQLTAGCSAELETHLNKGKQEARELDAVLKKYIN